VQVVAVPPQVEAEDRADQEPDRGLVRRDHDLSAEVRGDDPEQGGQGPRGDGEAGLAAGRRKRVRVPLPAGVLLAELLLDLRTALALPASVRDLAEAIDRRDRLAVRRGEDPAGLHRAGERARVERGDRLAREPA